MSNIIPKFLILMPWGRVGSNMVVASLKKQGNIPILNEPTTAIVSKLSSEKFSSFLADKKQIAEIDEFLKFLEPKKAAIAAGMKISHRSLVSPMLFYQTLAERGFKAVCMYRENLIKCAVSQIRAEKRARDLAKKGETATWAVTKDQEKPGAQTIDPERAVRLARHFESAQHYLDQYSEYCFGTNRLVIEYDDLASNPESKIEEIIQFIGLKEIKPIAIEHKKATSDDMSLDITNWDEFSAHISETEYAKFI